MASEPTPGAAHACEARRWIAGLMSGTSADGVDAALVELRGRGLGTRVDVRAWRTDPWPDELRRAILRATQPQGAHTPELAALHSQIGHAYATALQRVCEAAAVPIEDVTCVGCHGQTVWHAPHGQFASTLQLGAPAIVAEQTGLSVVSDFRWRDLAAAGEGAPLVPIVDWLLLRSDRHDRIAVNLGGIINLTYLPRGADLSAVRAFDVGPGNMLLDRLAQELTRGKDRYDTGGRLAVQGRQIKPLLRHWADHPFLKREPPKSTGREEFGEAFVQQTLELAARKGWSVLDVLCSATHFAAVCLADAVSRFLPVAEGIGSGVLVLSGGGVHNGLLVRAIAQRLAGWEVRRSDDFGLPVDAKEAIAFAVLAALAVDGVCANVPAATGAAGPRLLGSFTPGSPENWRRLLAAMRPA